MIHETRILSNDDADADADDQFMAAKYYRLAEENGNRTVGNSWYVSLFVSFFFPFFVQLLAPAVINNNTK